jgi:3-deoxy-D-manno-octulosonate 8-phosphate phosphatase (KDO 8-P phosphatase)
MLRSVDRTTHSMKMGNISKREIISAARKVRLLILDVDGVLTDGSILLDNDGNELKTFHVRDGHGIRLLQKAGIHVALITGRFSRIVERRARELGIRDVYQKCFDKAAAYTQLAKKYSLADHEIAYVGDDVVDIPVLRRCGLSVAVADAEAGVRPFVKMITKKGGGKGAVREVCNLLLQAKGLWKDTMDEYSQT